MGALSFLAVVTLQAATPVPAAPVANASTLSLEQATQTAIANQPLLRQAHAQSDAAAARADEARAPLLPQVTGTAGYTRSTANATPRGGTTNLAPTNHSDFATFGFWNVGVSASQLIYDFGQTPDRWHAAQSTAEGQKQTEQATRLQTVLNVRTTFFQARAQKALIVVAEETLKNQERHLAQIQGFVEIGTRPEIDLAQARTDVANAKVQVITAENAYATAKAQLNQAMGAPRSTDYDVADDTLPPVTDEDQSTEALVQSAIATRPEVVAFAKQVDAQQKIIRSARAGYGPQLSASTALTDAGASLDKLGWNWNAGVNLTWPLFQGMLVPAQVREAQANLSSVEAQRDTLAQQIRLEVEQARLAVRASKATIVAAEEALINARQRLRLAEGRYSTGVGSILELSDAQLAAASTGAQRVAADYNLASARALLIKALGR